MSTRAIEQMIFDVARVLLVPVLILALLSLVVVLVELGRLMAELAGRRRRGLRSLDVAAGQIRGDLAVGAVDAAVSTGDDVATSRAMAATLTTVIEELAAGVGPAAEDRVAKLLADFDYASVRRLERTRILVRVGPALGLMGTLIPLSPALAALAKGDVTTLSTNLRVAFSVTILGLLVGAIAFAISLVRDRLYSQDFSDLEYLAAAITPSSSIREEMA